MPVQSKPMVFIELDTGCFVCVTHLHNKDGYLRKAWGSRHKGQRVAEMFHRFIYRAHNGEIPEGYEVDHICENRACCNPNHLQAIPGDEHARKTNRTRYAARLAEAKDFWDRDLIHPRKPWRLARVFGVSEAAARLWIKKWSSQ